MKRKIPARKHHGIRDPIKQNEIKLAKIKNKINNPPDKQDQKIPYKLSQFMKLRDQIKNGKFIKPKNQIGREDLPKKTRQQKSKKIKPIKKFPNESDEDYLKRVNRITTTSLKESQYELKYGVNVIRDSKTGQIKVQKRPKNEIDEILDQKKRKRITDNKSKFDSKTAKEVVKEVLKKESEEKKSKDIEEYKRDEIKFGEVVHAPPSLTLPRKALKEDTVARPGKRDNLLLKNLLSYGKISKLESSTCDLRGKRKDLPVVTRLMIEEQQKKAIEMYRMHKKRI